LVHEHFHAILETGLDSTGRAAAGIADTNAWNQAAPLNEAVAAWMELEFLRRYPRWLGTPEEIEAARAALWAYVRAGPYPAWPYRGAERIEAIYNCGGTDAVRNLVLLLRDDPLAAMRSFEEIADPTT
jgi:hypothetical protein